MKAYKVITTITEDGRIILPPDLKEIFNHRVELLVLDKEIQNNKQRINKIPSYSCGGKLADISRGDLYEPR